MENTFGKGKGAVVAMLERVCFGLVKAAFDLLVEKLKLSVDIEGR